MSRSCVELSAAPVCSAELPLHFCDETLICLLEVDSVLSIIPPLQGGGSTEERGGREISTVGGLETQQRPENRHGAVHSAHEHSMRAG